ncbi:MAG TPA: tetratricopeptide repeat protein [Usitatibacter sp.]|nr:tetratricopeptide repeat protein [Usitatibacter sp.]
MTPPVHDIEKRLLQPAGAGDRVAALLELAAAHASAFRSKEGLRAAREALVAARAQGDGVSVGHALSIATVCHFQRSDYVAAVATGLDAVEAYAEDDVCGRSNALQSIALALFNVGAHDVASTAALRAIRDANACGEPGREAAARSVLGLILNQREEFNAARREFRQAAAIHRREGDLVKLKKSTINLAHTYRYQGHKAARGGAAPQARFYWTQACRVYRIALDTGNAPPDDAIILGSLAECELRLGRTGQALAASTRALQQGVECPMILAPCLLWHGEVLQALGQLKAAERACEQACHAADRLEHDEIHVRARHMLSKLCDLQGRFQDAADHERRSLELAADRAAFLARVREDLEPLWTPYMGDGPASRPRRAA